MSCWPCRRILADLQFLQQEADGDEVAVDQPLADLPHLGRDLDVQRADEILDGHGREEPVAAIDGGLAAARIDGLDGHDPLAFDVDLADPLVLRRSGRRGRTISRATVSHICPGPYLG